MFDYTKMVFEKTVKDVKAVAYFSNIATQVMYLIYLVYALIAKTGLWYVNALLLALSTAYFIYFLHSSNHARKDKHLDKKVKKFYTRIKQAIKLFPLGVALYSLCLTVENANAFTLISTAFMLIAWLLQLIFDVLGTIIGNRIDLFKEAIEADVDEFKKPVKTVENFFKRVSGKDIDEKAPSKTRIWLDEQIVDYRETKAEQRELAKQEKLQQRKEAFEAKKRNFLQGVKRVLNNGKHGNSTKQENLPLPKTNEGENSDDVE